MTRSRSEMARRLYILTAARGARSLVQSAVMVTEQNADWTLGVTPSSLASCTSYRRPRGRHHFPPASAKEASQTTAQRFKDAGANLDDPGLGTRFGGGPGAGVGTVGGWRSAREQSLRPEWCVPVAFLALIARRFSTSTWRRGRKRGNNGS